MLTPVGEAGPAGLRVMTFNIWDAPIVAQHRDGRVNALAAFLKRRAGRLDIVSLSELFHDDSFTKLARAGEEAGLKYQVRLTAGADLPNWASGCGVTVMSRFPIREVMFRRFTVNGSPYHLHRWDWHAGKGIGLCRVDTPWGGVDVYSTHLIAQYQDGSDDTYKPYRTAQVFEAAQFIRSTRKAPLCLLMGDLNCPPTSTEFKILQSMTRMRDAYSAGEAPKEGATARSIGDGTFGTQGNTFASTDPYGCCAPPQCDVDARLDYVLMHSAPGPTTWAVADAGFDAQDPVTLPGGHTVSLSDHLAVWADLEVTQGGGGEGKAGAAAAVSPVHSGGGGPSWVYPVSPSLDKASVALLEAANTTFHAKAVQMRRTRCQHIITGWVLAALALVGVALAALDLNALAPEGWDGAATHLQYVLGAAAPWLSLLSFALANDVIAIVHSPVLMMIGVVVLLMGTLAPLGLAVWVAGGIGIASCSVGIAVFASVVTLFTAHYITAPKMRAFAMLAQSSDIYLRGIPSRGGMRANSTSSADVDDVLVRGRAEGSPQTHTSLVDHIV